MSERKCHRKVSIGELKWEEGRGFLLQEKIIKHVEILGTVISISRKENFKKIEVDDGTGMIECVSFPSENEIGNNSKIMRDVFNSTKRKSGSNSGSEAEETKKLKTIAGAKTTKTLPSAGAPRPSTSHRSDTLADEYVPLAIANTSSRVVRARPSNTKATAATSSNTATSTRNTSSSLVETGRPNTGNTTDDISAHPHRASIKGLHQLAQLNLQPQPSNCSTTLYNLYRTPVDITQLTSSKKTKPESFYTLPWYARIKPKRNYYQENTKHTKESIEEFLKSLSEKIDKLENPALVMSEILRHGNLVSVRGRLTMFRNVRQVIASKVTRVDDPNALMIHMKQIAAQRQMIENRGK